MIDLNSLIVVELEILRFWSLLGEEDSLEMIAKNFEIIFTEVTKLSNL